MKKIFSFVAVALSLLAINAAELKVDYSGKDTTAYKNFKSALKASRPGDTITILPVDFVIRDSIIINNYKASPDKPLTVNGSFNTFSGVSPLDPAEWKKVDKGLWERKMRLNRGFAERYFMVIDGHIVRMGRFFKGKCPYGYKKVQNLKKNEWTLIEDKKSRVKNTSTYSIYLKLDESVVDITKSKAEEPRRGNICGVELSGKCDSIIIKNFICRNFWNDGYNIHNKVVNTTFDTICAIDCGDDGISAHESCEIKVENFVSFGNSTGICHCQLAVCTHNNVYIEGALGRDIYLPTKGDNKMVNVINNSLIVSSSASGVYLGDNNGITKIDNMTVCYPSGKVIFEYPITSGCKAQLSRLKILSKPTAETKKFKADILAKFHGKIEKQLEKR